MVIVISPVISTEMIAVPMAINCLLWRSPAPAKVASSGPSEGGLEFDIEWVERAELLRLECGG